MSFQTPITIAQAISNIENNRYLLPSIQREFVWDHDRIEWLFDSIMKGYPISSFLFWDVRGETKQKFKFYKFLRTYREWYGTHNEQIDTPQDFTAVLDGQQRLTALYIGLKGSFAYKLPRVKWENSEKNMPTRHLYLNIIKPLENQEDGRYYEFRFLTSQEYIEDKQSSKWFKIADIMKYSDDFEFNKFLDNNNYKENEFTYKTLSVLKNSIHSKPIINFYLEGEQSIDKALNIFIRINSGGESLNYSDLLMSIAVANWATKNARDEINKLVDLIRDKGFAISKDFILKTFLMLHSSDIKFSVNNFSVDNAKDFESKWEKIRDAISDTFELTKLFGFVNSTLTSKNALIPIIYYIYHKEINDICSSTSNERNRQAIKEWLHLVLLKRRFGSHSDSILIKMRNIFTSDFRVAYIANNINEFPLTETGFDDEEIDLLLSVQKDDKYAFSTLAVLYPNMDYKNNNFHIDHLHPISSFAVKNLKQLNLTNEQLEFFQSKEHNNSILNLQMLDANENMSKKDKTLDKWVEIMSPKASGEQNKFLKDKLIPNTNLDLSNFQSFIEERRKLLIQKLKSIKNTGA